MRLIFCIGMILVSKIVKPCLILYLSDGNEILVANHEDWFAKNAAVRMIPATEDRYSSIIFTFEDEGWAQGGMNEHGLFFDGAMTPNPELENVIDQIEYPGYVWQAVLDNCKTVEEALDFIRKFKLPDLETAHIVFADAEGSAALVGIENGNVVIHQSKEKLLQTNFNRWHPELSEEPVCERYNAATQITIDQMLTKELMLKVLRDTHQDSLTVYSNIYDLKRREIVVYSRRQFDRPIQLSFNMLASDQDCMFPLDALFSQEEMNCLSPIHNFSGRVIDEKGLPLPFVNIGIKNTYLGTISDPDGTFVLDLSPEYLEDSVTFSSIGYEDEMRSAASLTGNTDIMLRESATVLKEVVVQRKKSYKKLRIGHMVGKDGVLPFDSITGGGAVSILLEAPASGFYIDKLQYRLLYNSKDTSRFRLHFYELDSVCDCPGSEILTEEIILKGEKRFGWERFDLSDKELFIPLNHVFVGLEWLEDRSSREKMLAGLKEWEEWKRSQYVKGDEKVEKVISSHPNGTEWVYYKYHGNMMTWPGWDSLPSFTGLMVETGKTEATMNYRTFERKTSFSPWKEKNVTLNLVIQIAY